MTQHTSVEKHIRAYKHMLERVKDLLESPGQAGKGLEQSIEAVKRAAVQDGELTHEEAEAVGRFVKRDLREAGRHRAATGNDLRAWLGIDMQLMEDWLLDMFAQVADKTELEWFQLEQNAREASLYHTGEITGPGTLTCSTCGEVVHFHDVGHIPPCPRCRETVFTRPTK